MIAAGMGISPHVSARPARVASAATTEGEPMRLVDRILHREVPKETPCPRCGIPAPPQENECAACGWDLHETYHGRFTGSHLEEHESDPRT
jgi:hypothetical protein